MGTGFRRKSWAKANARLGAGLGLLDVERRHLALDGEIAILEAQRTRDAVLVNLEGDGIDRCLLTGALDRGVLLLEIADSHRPARELAKLGDFRRRIIRRLRPRRGPPGGPRARAGG